MQPTPPFWFRQRQGQMEPAGQDAYRLTAPNLGEAFISIRQTESGRWLPSLRLAAAGPDVAQGQLELDNPHDAWDAAFELYRVHVVV
jgi:hypothetical protein